MIQSLSLPTIDRDELTELIRNNYPAFSTIQYSIVNIRNGQRIIVGSLGNTLTISGKIYFPGNTTVSAAAVTTVITLAIANGTDEIYKKSKNPSFAYFYQGARYAVARSNLLNDIPRFSLKLFPTNCGIYLFNSTFYNNYYSPIIHDLGIAYLSGFWYSTSYGNLVTLKSLGLNLPQISPFAQDTSVDNSAKFPEFLKLSVTAEEYQTNGFIFMKSLGWNKVVVLATDDPIYSRQYQNVYMYSNSSGVTIINPPDKRIFPSNYTRNDFEKYRSYFQAAKDTMCRFFIVVAIDRGAIWEGLYDIGLRRGDIFLVTEATALPYLSGVPPQYLMKREELILDSFAMSYREFLGELGTTLRTEMSKIFPALTFLCMCYDTVSVVKEAVNYILAKGDDYEDPETLQTAMRNNKITGCLGSLFFGTESNSRGSAQFLLQQFRQNATGSWYLENIVFIDKLSSQVITVVNPVEWPSGNNTTPSLFRPISPCPFDSYLIVDSPSGKNVLYSLCAIFFVISIIAAYLAYRYLNPVIKPLTEKQVITFADMIFILYFFFQFVQLTTVGPDQDSYKYLLNNFQVLISLDFSLYFQVQFENFWKLFFSVLCFAIVWIFLCFAVIFKCDDAFEDNFFCGKIKFLTELLLPILGHIGFLPIFSMLLNIFLCNKAIGSSLTDSYLDADCAEFCYTGTHRAYAVISAIAISFYLPLAIYCRSIWESTQPSLNLATSPTYLSLLSIFQVTIVILNKTLKIANQVVHGYAVSAIIVGFIVITMKMKPYNYYRNHVLQISSLALALCAILCATVFRDLNMVIPWIVTELIGFLVIIVVGVLVMRRYPSLLYSRKGTSISTLFIFQFCKNYHKYIRDPDSFQLSQRESADVLDRNIMDIPKL